MKPSNRIRARVRFTGYNEHFIVERDTRVVDESACNSCMMASATGFSIYTSRPEIFNDCAFITPPAMRAIAYTERVMFIILHESFSDTKLIEGQRSF
jgi:hypothetical protein